MTPDCSHGLPRIAVVIPCYNSEAWIGRAIDSVLAQDYPDLVLCVIDDGSSDGSAALVGSYGSRVLLEGGPNRGPCHARNRGTRAAERLGATHILYLDADDYLEGPMLAGAGRLAAETGADIVLSDNPIEYPDGQRRDRRPHAGIDGAVPPEDIFTGWLVGDYFNPSAILWTLAFVDRLGGWDERLRRGDDTDFALRAMLLAPHIRRNHHGAAVYSKGIPTSLSSAESEPAMEGLIGVFVDLAQRARGTPCEPIIPLVARNIYSASYRAYRAGYHRLGRRGFRELARLGFQGHAHMPLAQLVFRLVSLDAKLRLLGK